MDQELYEYLDGKFTRIEDKLDTKLKDVDDRVDVIETKVSNHSQLFAIIGGVTGAGVAAAIAKWFSKF